MDQTKFINSYINNLAEQLKTMTLDNVMLKTQLNVANDSNLELKKRIEELEMAINKPKKQKSEWSESTSTEQP
jgi:predicted nuclease with TOPRIM domain